MQLVVKTLTCPCGHQHDTGVVPPNSYGEFLLRSARDATVRYVNSLEDPVYNELHDRIAKHPQHLEDSARERADVLQRIFGITCDSSIGSTDLMIGRFPKCPSCGADAVVDWVLSEPLQFEELDVPAVTHTKWQQLSDAEKQALVDKALGSS